MKSYVALVAALLFACGGHAEGPVKSPAPRPAPAPAPAPSPSDPQGARPDVALPEPYLPPAPIAYRRPNGLTVWLLERHALPVVTMTMAIPYGSANDPKGQEGLTMMTANMLDEGAGKRSALELSRDIALFGASLDTDAHQDWSHVRLRVLKTNLKPAFGIFADVVLRPRFDPSEWKRVHALWVNGLKARSADPEGVMEVVAQAVAYGSAHPYAHRPEGNLANARRVALDSAKKQYAALWRPDRATLVVVGDMTRGEVDSLLDEAFAAWTASKAPAPETSVPKAPGGKRPKLVLVDRPEAPQSIIAFVRPGPSAGDPVAAPLSRANIALGGSFTSRLNQDLREERGWTYGVHSRFTFLRGPGTFESTAAVFVDKTTEAIGVLMEHIDKFAREGLTDEELVKTRLQGRSELVQMFETTDGAALRLARDASLGLPVDFESKASLLRDRASGPELARMLKEYFATQDGTVVVVGPKAKLEGPLKKLGLGDPELWTAEGTPAVRP